MTNQKTLLLLGYGVAFNAVMFPIISIVFIFLYGFKVFGFGKREIGIIVEKYPNDLIWIVALSFIGSLIGIAYHWLAHGRAYQMLGGALILALCIVRIFKLIKRT